MTKEKLAVATDSQIFKCISAQLEFIEYKFKTSDPPTEEDKERITLGALAAREFETSDPEYADILFKVAYLFKHPEIDKL